MENWLGVDGGVQKYSLVQGIGLPGNLCVRNISELLLAFLEQDIAGSAAERKTDRSAWV